MAAITTVTTLIIVRPTATLLVIVGGNALKKTGTINFLVQPKSKLLPIDKTLVQDPMKLC